MRLAWKWLLECTAQPQLENENPLGACAARGLGFENAGVKLTPDALVDQVPQQVRNRHVALLGLAFNLGLGLHRHEGCD